MVLLLACSHRDGGAPVDAGPRDAGAAVDSGAAAVDAGSEDAGSQDAGSQDAGTIDAGSTSTDAGTTDARSNDDAGGGDAGPLGECGTLGRSCADGRSCTAPYVCDESRRVCVPEGRTLCGGFAGATCTDSRTFTECLFYTGADFGPCLTFAEAACVCADATRRGTFQCPLEE